MRTQLRRAGELRIGDRVICVDGPATVTSTRIEGVGGGTVSVGLTAGPTAPATGPATWSPWFLLPAQRYSRANDRTGSGEFAGMVSGQDADSATQAVPPAITCGLPTVAG